MEGALSECLAPNRVLDTLKGGPKTEERELSNSEPILGFKLRLDDFSGSLDDIREEFLGRGLKFAIVMQTSEKHRQIY